MFAKPTEDVLQIFRPLREHLSEYLSEIDIELVYQAFRFSAYYHEGQLRYSGEPYLMHPVAVAIFLAEWRLDVESIQAGLLHDLIEDTSVDKTLLSDHFGDSVAELVDGVSKLTQIKFNNRLEAQAENFRKMFLAMAQDLRVILVKLADRLHNMHTVHILPGERCRRIARETLDIYAPIANRIGMHAVALELEDLGFSALYPDRSRIIKAAVSRVQGTHSDILKEIQTRFQQQLKEINIPVNSISSRAKHVYSIYCKMRDKGLPFSKITDVYAIRIVAESIDACYRILGVIHGVYKPVPGRLKDYIALPKANGYQSLHTVLFGPYGVPIEVQIRTRQMDLCADGGLAAHWQYKLGVDSDLKAQQTQRWVQRLMEIQKRTGNSLEFLENVKVDLFPDEIYVFTPKGDIIALPAGATAIDFAYAVHTDVGNQCVAVKIDRQLSPLSTVLTNGYTIEVMISPQAVPSSTWLDFVRTAKARSSIRHHLKQEQNEQSARLGERLLSAALVHKGLDLDCLSPDIQKHLSEVCRVNHFSELLEDIGLGRRVAKIVVGQLQQLIDHQPKHSSPLKSQEEPLMISGTEGMVVQCATCCFPVPGDPIVGQLISEAGIEVHHGRCQVLHASRETIQRQHIAVSWAEDIQGDYRVEICIDALNQRGVLATLALAVADAKSSIIDVHVEQPDGVNIYVVLEIFVTDRVQLAQVIRRIRRISEVLKVKRGGQLLGVMG